MDGAPQEGDGPDATGRSTPSPAAPEHRQWRHPSELGHQSRVAADRRRGHRMALGVVISGLGILLATATIASHLSNSGSRPEQVAEASPTSAAASVTAPGPGSSGPGSGAVWVGLQTEDSEPPEPAEPAGPSGPDQLPGALVMAVEPDSPAEHGGLAVGDLVVSVDDAMVHTGAAMHEHVNEHAPGDEVRFGIVRDDQLHSMMVVVTAPR